MRIARIATEYRYEFGTDVVIDLIGYRRHGHSEVDDPTVTQPLMYKAIKQHPPLYQIYARQIGIDADHVAERVRTIKSEYEAAQKIAHQRFLGDLHRALLCGLVLALDRSEEHTSEL